jgi:hypothetical protein
LSRWEFSLASKAPFGLFSAPERAAKKWMPVFRKIARVFKESRAGGLS